MGDVGVNCSVPPSSPHVLADEAPHPKKIKALAITAGDGPWKVTRYSVVNIETSFELLSESERRGLSIMSSSDILSLNQLGSVVCTSEGEWPRTEAYKNAGKIFEFEAEQDRQGATRLEEVKFAGSGVGHQIWDSAVVMALYLRSALAPEPFGRSTSANVVLPRVLELGAGVGLPGIDLAFRSAASNVMLTDCHEPLVELLERNSQASADGPRVPVSVAKLDWTQLDEVEHFASQHDYDVVIGSDLCYMESQVAGIAEAIHTLRAPLAVIISPASRGAAHQLRQALLTPGFRVETQCLRLIRSDAEAIQPTPHSSLFLVNLVSPVDAEICEVAVGV